MRQTALISLLAYCGSYVPAQSAVLGPIDQSLPVLVLQMTYLQANRPLWWK